jgi:hypothetical protein
MQQQLDKFAQHLGYRDYAHMHALTADDLAHGFTKET